MKVSTAITGLLFLLVLNMLLGAEEIPKFGKVSDEELQMTAIPEDPEADAVVLFDVGDLRIREGSEKYYLTMERHTRVKILTEKGKDYASVSIPFWHEDRIHDLKAHTVLPNGKKIKMDKKAVFEEKVDKTGYKKFALPGVEVGAVIEYTYKLESDYLYNLEPWFFQNNEFTRLSQYSVIVLPYFGYSVFFRNTLDMEPETEDILDPQQRRKLTRYIWRMKDQPPIRKEPYMRTLNDYRAAINFQIREFKSPYAYHKYISDWPDLVKEMREHYDRNLDDDKSLKEIVQSEAPDSLRAPERIKNLYAFVRDQIETGERGYRAVEKSPEEALKDRQGIGVEKNLLLVNLLMLAGFDAHPLLISTRYNGRIVEQQPRLTQFNYMLAYAKYGSRTYVLDTRYSYCPFNLLPVDDLVETGLVINKGTGGFIQIPKPRALNMLHCANNLTLSEAGHLNGEAMVRFEGYRALVAREKIRDADEKEFVEELLKDRFSNAAIDSFEISGLEDMEAPLYLKVRYRVPEFAQVVGDMIYLPAPLLNYHQSNPFEREHRYYPVEFAYSLASTDEVNLTLPEGFQVTELPEGLSNRQKAFDLTYVTAWEAGEGSVTVKRQFMRQREMYSPREYRPLRDFYDKIVGSDNSQLVLSRAGGDGTALQE